MAFITGHLNTVAVTQVVAALEDTEPEPHQLVKAPRIQLLSAAAVLALVYLP
jgi:hypothetical protein